jgi:hypothetical protein
LESIGDSSSGLWDISLGQQAVFERDFGTSRPVVVPRWVWLGEDVRGRHQMTLEKRIF